MDDTTNISDSHLFTLVKGSYIDKKDHKYDQMSKYQKLSLIISTLAIIISIANILWFSSERQKLFYAGRLAASIGLYTDQLSVHLYNEGYQTVSGISVGLESISETIDIISDVDMIEIFPINDFDLKINGSKIYITPKVTLAKGEGIIIYLPVELTKPHDQINLEDCLNVSITSSSGMKQPVIIQIEFYSRIGF